MKPAHYVGIDVGGTKTAAALVSFPAAGVRFRRVIPTRPRRGGRAVLDDTLALARTLLAEARGAGIEPAGIGLGVCELVDLKGNITSAQTLEWPGLPVLKELQSLGPAVVESDVRAAAIAEALLGAGRPYPLFVFVTVGTGISYCLVRDGRPYAGARGNAITFTSAALVIPCEACGSRQSPVIEAIASGPGIVERYNRGGSEPARSAEDVLARAAAGEAAAAQVVHIAAEVLGGGVAWLINVLDPEAVIVGGGLGSAGGLYWDTLVHATRDHIFAENARDTPILQAALGPDAGLIGAAAAAWQGLRSPRRPSTR